MIDNNIKWQIMDRLSANRDEKVLCMIIGEDKSVTTYADCKVDDFLNMFRSLIKYDFYTRRVMLEMCIELLEEAKKEVKDDI